MQLHPYLDIPRPLAPSICTNVSRETAAGGTMLAAAACTTRARKKVGIKRGVNDKDDGRPVAEDLSGD